MRNAGADGSLGEQLRRARTARGISLREISDQTRITMRHLEAIEADDYKHLPGGIFNRSFVKAYARAIDFDEKRALDLYSRQMRESGEDLDEVQTTPHRSRVYTDGDVGRSPVLTFALSALLVGILSLGIYALWYAYDKRFGSGARLAANAANANAQANAAAPTPTPSPTPVADFEIEVKTARNFYLTVEEDGNRVYSNNTGAQSPPLFKPKESLTIIFDDNVQYLNVSINGRSASIPSDAPGKVTITKENYQSFLR